MDIDEIARKIRSRIFDQAEDDGRVMHKDAMDRVIADVLRKELPRPSSPYAYGGLCVESTLWEFPRAHGGVVVECIGGGGGAGPGVGGGTAERPDPVEWR